MKAGAKRLLEGGRSRAKRQERLRYSTLCALLTKISQHFTLQYLDGLMPSILEKFWPQQVVYNGGIANVKNWKISCYLEVMEGGVPCTNPCLPLLDDCSELLDAVDAAFTHWYKQQHACNKPGVPKREEPYKVKRVMNFITRYTANPNEQALLKHVDGAGKVDGSAVIALPVDRWTGPEEIMSFEGHGGGEECSGEHSGEHSGESHECCGLWQLLTPPLPQDLRSGTDTPTQRNSRKYTMTPEAAILDSLIKQYGTKRTQSKRAPGGRWSFFTK